MKTEHASVTGLAPVVVPDLLPQVVAAVQAAGQQLKAHFVPENRTTTLDEILQALQHNDALSLQAMRPLLEKAHPAAGWIEDELDSGPLPAGDWWVTDPVEGNINHVHGTPDWGVSATLVRDNVPVLTVVHLPLSDSTYTAVLGQGAFQNGQPLKVSGKGALNAALVGTGQAMPGEDADTFRRMGASAVLMLEHALVLKVSVPATLQLVQVAAGRQDLFWQYSQVRSGLLAGALLVQEAGGTLSDTAGNPWTLDSKDFLATTSLLQDAAVGLLSTIP